MEVDIAYSLNFLRKINSLSINGKSINEYFMQGTYSLWSFQQFYLLTQIKDFSKYKSTIDYKKSKEENFSFLLKINVTIMNIFIIGISLLALLKLYIQRPKVLLFCSDILKPGTRFNPRIFNIYLALQKNQVSFIEIVHTVGGKKIISNFFKFRRLVFYSESINAIFSLLKNRVEEMHDSRILEGISLDVFNESEKKFVLDLLEKTFENIHISKFKIKLLEHILSSSNISTFVTIDDVRHTNEIIAACENIGIHSCLYQHSNFDYLIGLDQLPPDSYVFPDTFFVWNQYWYKRIPELSSLFFIHKERIKIGGRAYLFAPGECTQREKEEEVDQASISILVPYEVNVSMSHIRPHIEAMINESRIKIFLLLRDDIDSATQIHKYFVTSDLDNPRVTIVKSCDKEKTLKKIDIVVGVYSGFLDESIEICKPVAVLQTEYPVFNRLDDGDMVGQIILAKGNLYEQLVSIKNTSYNTRKERREKFLAETGDAQKSVLEILEI